MDFWEKIKQGVLVADGAMGTLLYERGVPKGHCYDELNLSNSLLIKEIHKAYVDAGAELIETNTFGANEYILSKYYDLGKKSKEINYRGAKLARESAQDLLVAGSVGPITRPLESWEKLRASEIEEIFSSQILALVEGGVDLIILETMASIDELILGFRSAKRICDLPIICQLSFTEEGRTILGVDPVEATIKLNKEEVQIMGVNCGIGPQSVYESIYRMGHLTKAILSAQPNAGRASWTGEKFVYPATPEYFADYAKRYVNSGVSIIGGCCGTTPAHIFAVKEAVKSLSPLPRKIVQIKGTELKPTPTTRLAEATSRSAEVPSSLQEKLKKKFILSLELSPPKGANIERELFIAKNFKNLGGDCVNISDNPMSRLRMSPVPLAHIIRENIDIEIILHFTCRDRNLLAIQSDLIGMFALGIQNILALTGDPPSVGDYPFATAVFEINSEGLVEIINSLNQGIDRLGNPILESTSFFVGVASRLDEALRTKGKINKGARFIQTQPCFDVQEFQKFSSRFIGLEIPVIAGLLVLGSLRQAEFIQNEVPGITIPAEIMERMRKGASNEGALIARELLQELRKFSSGVCIMLPSGKYELVEKILE